MGKPMLRAEKILLNVSPRRPPWIVSSYHLPTSSLLGLSPKASAVADASPYVSIEDTIKEIRVGKNADLY